MKWETGRVKSSQVKLNVELRGVTLSHITRCAKSHDDNDNDDDDDDDGCALNCLGMVTYYVSCFSTVTTILQDGVVPHQPWLDSQFAFYRGLSNTRHQDTNLPPLHIILNANKCSLCQWVQASMDPRTQASKDPRAAHEARWVNRNLIALSFVGSTHRQIAMSVDGDDVWWRRSFWTKA